MPDTHECPGPGCKRQVPYIMLACGRHWRHIVSTHTVAAHEAYERTTDYIRRVAGKGDTDAS